MPELRVTQPIIVSTIENAPLVTVRGTVGVGSINAVVDVGTIQAIVDVATIQNVGSIESPIVVSAIASPVAISTIYNAPLITVQGTLGATLESNVIVATIENAPLITVTGSVEVQNIVQASTSGSVQSFDVSAGTVATPISGDASLIYSLTILAEESNTAPVFVGSATLQSFPLRPGASVTLDYVAPKNVYVLGSISAQIVHVIYGGS